MKAPHATTTPDLLPDHDLAGERPPKKSRLANWRAKNGLTGVSVNLPSDLVEQFEQKRLKSGKTKNEVFEHLIRTQYLRGR